MTAHFNLAVLSDESSSYKNFDAQKPETTSVDAALSTSTADEETLRPRFQAGIIVQIGIQRGYNLPEPFHQLAKENMDLLMASQWVMI